MRLDWAIPCGSVTIDDNGNVTETEYLDFDTLEVEAFPSEAEIVVLIRAAGLPEDFLEDADRNVEAHLIGPGMEPLLSIDFELPSLEPGPGYREGWELNAKIPLVLQFTVRAEGTHELDLYIKGKLQPKSVFFQIRPAAKERSAER
jgi:hypothetical protein